MLVRCHPLWFVSSHSGVQSPVFVLSEDGRGPIVIDFFILILEFDRKNAVRR